MDGINLLIKLKQYSNNKKMFTKINKRLSELEDVLTRPGKDNIGSELDGKVEQSDFDYFKKNVIGEEEESGSVLRLYYTWDGSWGSGPKKKTLLEEIKDLKESIKKIENYLGIARLKTESDKYVKVNKTKKRR